MKVTYTEEAVADIVEAITYLNERNPTVLRSDPAAALRNEYPSSAGVLTLLDKV